MQVGDRINEHTFNPILAGLMLGFLLAKAPLGEKVLLYYPLVHRGMEIRVSWLDLWLGDAPFSWSSVFNCKGFNAGQATGTLVMISLISSRHTARHCAWIKTGPAKL